MIEVRCFDSLKEAAYLRDEINALNRNCARPDPFSSFEFFEAFLQHNEVNPPGRDGMKLWFLAAFDANRLVGYLALKQQEHRVMGLRASKLDFLVTHDADRPQLVARPENARAASEAFYAYLLKRKREWTFLEFRQQDAASHLFPPPVTVDLHGYAVRQWPSMDNGTIPIHGLTLDAYFKSFSKRFRSNVSRQMRSLLAAGDVEYVASSDPAVTPALFELYRSVERRSWKSLPGVAIGRHPQWAGYFTDLLDARQPMRVSIHLVFLDGIPVAGLITGAFEQGLYALHIVFDQSFSRLAPGSAVLLMGMRQAIDGRYDFFNLLSGFGYFKARWRAQMSVTRNAQIYRIGTPFFWRRLVGDLKRRVYPLAEGHHAWLSNPARRQVMEKGTEAADAAAPGARSTAGERQRVTALIARACQGRSEYLSSSGLAAVLPFTTGRDEPKGAGRVNRTACPDSAGGDRPG